MIRSSDCPLIDAFENRHSAHKSGQSRSVDSNFGSSNDDSGFNLFDTSHWLLNSSESCNNHQNQHLYSKFIEFANWHLHIGALKRNMGHFCTGKNWCNAGKQILCVSYSHVVALGCVDCLASFHL